jgi:hypothetical protein
MAGLVANREGKLGDSHTDAPDQALATGGKRGSNRLAIAFGSIAYYTPRQSAIDAVWDGGVDCTEANRNGFVDSQAAEILKRDECTLLVVANKLQTGFDHLEEVGHLGEPGGSRSA